MDLTYSIQSNTNSSPNIRSVFSCLYSPAATWNLNNTTPSWILAVLLYIASPATIILNALVIVVVKQRKELRRNSNILLTSMVVAGLLMGALNMPLRATVDTLILRHLWFHQICLLDFLNVSMTSWVFFSSLYHLTAIAWERYIAIVKWMDYNVIVTRNRLTNLAIIAWLASVFTVLPVSITIGFGMTSEIVEIFFIIWTLFLTVALIVTAYFYVKVYLGIRKRRSSKISQVSILVQAKLEFKVAKTSLLLTASVIFFKSPVMVAFILGKVFPSIHSVVDFRIWEGPSILYSLATPILYCYRDRRFRNAVFELLRVRKPPAIAAGDDTVRYVRRKHPTDGVNDFLELQNVGKSVSRLLTRTASCDLALIPECVHGESQKIALKRSLSAPTLHKCNILFDGLQLQQHTSTLLATTAEIHPSDAKLPISRKCGKESVNP